MSDNMTLEKLAQKVTDSSEEVNKGIAELDRKQHERFTNLEARVCHVESRLGRVEDKLDREQDFTSDIRDDHEPRLRVGAEIASHYRRSV